MKKTIDLRERARALSDEFGWAMTEESINGIASLCAAIRAEAKAEGWDDAVKALGNPDDEQALRIPGYATNRQYWAEWLAANRPSPTEK